MSAKSAVLLLHFRTRFQQFSPDHHHKAPLQCMSASLPHRYHHVPGVSLLAFIELMLRCAELLFSSCAGLFLCGMRATCKTIIAIIRPAPTTAAARASMLASLAQVEEWFDRTAVCGYAAFVVKFCYLAVI